MVARILVIDDEPKIVSLVSRVLREEGFAVDGALDGVHALHLLRARAYELIILDLRMPGLNGVSVLRGALESRPDQRVLVLSALTEVESKVRCFELGASDYVTKPFEADELVARVQTRLREAGTAIQKRYLAARGLRLDLLRREVHAGNGAIALSAREFLLLHSLMRAAGEVCPREQLLREVWGYSFDPGTNILDVYVRRLRSKLGAGVIDTVRNVGYSVEAA